MATNKEVVQALSKVVFPRFKRNVVELGMAQNVEVHNGAVRFTLALPTLTCPMKDRVVSSAKATVLALDGIQRVDVDFTEMSAEEKQRLGLGKCQPGKAEHLNDIRHVIAVMSGKGGVGKSLVSGLLAVALRRAGYQVGLLDADITGPSIPKMFFRNGTRAGSRPGVILPVESDTGIKVMSMSLLLSSEYKAVIWRGPIISRAVEQFWGDVWWGLLDYLVVDLPPGTPDASLTVLKSLPASGIVLVTSPQTLASIVVQKAAQMAQHMNVPILGLIENMSYFLCPDNGQRYELFGPSHAEETASQLGIPFLGRLPIDPKIAKLCDSGQIEDYPAEAFAPIAEQLPDRAPLVQLGHPN